MKTIDEKEKKLEEVLNELKNLEIDKPHKLLELENLENKKNQLEIEKKELLVKYNSLEQINENLRLKLEELEKREINDRKKEEKYLNLSSFRSNKFLKWKAIYNIQETISQIVEWETYFRKHKKVDYICKKQITEYLNKLKSN